MSPARHCPRTGTVGSYRVTVSLGGGWVWPNSMALVTECSTFQHRPSAQAQWHHPLRKVTCWQGDNTEPFVPPKAQRLVLTGMDTFQAWACRASLSSGIGSRLSGPRTQTPLSSMLDVGTRFTGEGLQWARSWDTRSLTATHHEHHSRGAGSGL